MNPEEIAQHHEAMAAGRRAQAEIDASRTAAPAPLTKEERAEFLSHSEELLPSNPFANQQPPPMTGEITNPAGSSTWRSSTADLPPGVEPWSVLAFIRSPHGQTRASHAEVLPTDIITIGGTQTKLETALKVGAVVRGSDGTLSFPLQSPAEVQAVDAAAEKAASEAEFAEVNIVTKNLAETFAHIDSLTGDGLATENLVASVVAKAAQSGTAEAGNLLTARLRLDPKVEDSQGFVSAAIEDGRNSVIAKLSTFGVSNGAQVLDHLAETLSPGAKAALALELLHGSRSAFDRLIATSQKLARHASVGK